MILENHNNNDSCECTTTSTTINCIDVAEEPCEAPLCEAIYDLKCIYYDGPDSDCHNVENGDNIVSVIQNLISITVDLTCITQQTPNPCGYGTAVSSFIEPERLVICATIRDQNCSTNIELTYSYYTVDDPIYTISVIAEKPIYVSNDGAYQVKWNESKKVYEMFYNSQKIAFTNKQNLQTSTTLTWQMVPLFNSNIKGVKTRKNECI